MSSVAINPETTLNIVSNNISTGTGPTLIFLHYWGGSCRTFAPLISTLSPHHRSVSVDFRGWGNSTAPQTLSHYSILDLALDVEALIAKLDIHDFVLVGHSMGGKVAQLIGGRAKIHGLRAIILIGPAPPSPLILPEDMKAAQMTAYDSAESAEFVVRNILSSSALIDTTVKFLVDDIMKGSAFAKLAWPTYSIMEDIVSEAKKITVPVLVIAGALDKIEPLERLQMEVVGNISTAEIVVVEGSGHLLPVEAPVQVAILIEEFLKSVCPF